MYQKEIEELKRQLNYNAKGREDLIAQATSKDDKINELNKEKEDLLSQISLMQIQIEELQKGLPSKPPAHADISPPRSARTPVRNPIEVPNRGIEFGLESVIIK